MKKAPQRPQRRVVYVSADIWPRGRRRSIHVGTVFVITEQHGDPPLAYRANALFRAWAEPRWHPHRTMALMVVVDVSAVVTADNRLVSLTPEAQ